MTPMMSAKCPCETATLSQRESLEIGERREGGKEPQEQKGDSGRIVPVSDSPFSLISSLLPEETRRGKEEGGRGGGAEEEEAKKLWVFFVFEAPSLQLLSSFSSSSLFISTGNLLLAARHCG